jgi:multicomponent Na+:H+ antiporter subunit F
MTPLVLTLSFGALTLAILLGLVRLARGPTVIDRVLAFDLIATSAVGMILLLSIHWRTALYLELVLIFSLLGFLTTVAFVFYLHKTVEPQPAPETGGDNPPAHPTQP